VDALARIAERKILEAIEAGELNSEKWKNKPLPLDDDRFVPEDLKMAYKILKNSGYLPPEIEAKKEIKKLEDLIACTEDEHVRLKQMKKLNLLLMKLDARRSTPSNIAAQDDYYRKVVERVTLNSQKNKKAGQP
jgi:DnaJ homologue, subfamily C, member 28, conserved domain